MSTDYDPRHIAAFARWQAASAEERPAIIRETVAMDIDFPETPDEPRLARRKYTSADLDAIEVSGKKKRDLYAWELSDIADWHGQMYEAMKAALIE
jgi:hypothetical protein